MLRLLPILLLTFSLLLTACDSANADGGGTMAPAGVEAWVGSYTGQARFGGTGGTWGNGGTFPLVVTASGQVTVSGALITNPTHTASTGTLTWSLSDGNATNGDITFRTRFTSDVFFADLANNTAGQNFTGSIRKSGEGGLEYRGVLR